MKDATFQANSKIFSEVKEIKARIKNDIHNKSRNQSYSSASASAGNRQVFKSPATSRHD